MTKRSLKDLKALIKYLKAQGITEYDDGTIKLKFDKPEAIVPVAIVPEVVDIDIRDIYKAHPELDINDPEKVLYWSTGTPL